MQEINPGYLSSLIAAVAPIDGISIGQQNDKNTWVVHFQPVATDIQKTAAQAVIDSFDPLAPTPTDVRDASFIADTNRADLLARLKTATPAQIDTWLTNNVTTLAQARAVLGQIIKVIALNVAR